MDIVLEVFETFIGDRIYASLLPLKQTQHTWSPLDLLSPLPNATWASMEEQAIQNYKWEPASQFFSVEPSQYAYMSRLPRDNAWRQAISLYFITWIFGLVIYFTVAGLSYIFVFDKSTMKHPKFLKNQVRKEIRQTMESIPIMAFLTVPFFLAEVRGYSKIYDTLPASSLFYLGGWWSLLQFPFFLLFTDAGIYAIHLWLHTPMVYKRLHKPHHKWVLPSPFASHAFHPVDGWAQSVPYHVFPFLFPLQKFAYIALFAFIQIWTVLIHDGEFYADNPIINGAACHSVHHLEFLGNYGQFTTLFDRLGGTYRKPGSEMYVKARGKKDN
ncbi:sterol delta 5,6-desaturase ERG3 [Elsinoe ampelina]|uniref:Sterol delta 5,6-desaturase ERG3 n=1 Tax=Elsinoe ampelina TaxID=302913 RepID=A0A6A6GLP8_9PEZI|nr:sterol delta 5,6-desaturase ERG3 [Elsinoe ampelina]